MPRVMLGIDLAKNVFSLHCLNETGTVDLRRPAVMRGKLRPSCLSSDLGGARFRHEQ